MNQHRLYLALACILCCALLGCPLKDQAPPPPGPVLSHPTPMYKITGTVTGADSIDRTGIVLKIVDHAYSALTDPLGRFTIDSVPTGNYTLVPYMDGRYFEPSQREITVDEADITEQDFTIFAYIDVLKSYTGTQFFMGSTNGQPIEGPIRLVDLPSFAIARYEVTQREWMTVMGSNPSQVRNPDNPVESVTWFDAVNFCNKLSEHKHLRPAYVVNGTSVVCDFTAPGYRLPTEAEWEFACRAGTRTDRYSGNGMPADQECHTEPTMDLIGWYCNNSGDQTHPVGTKQPNSGDMYDMLGNVSEWCWDWYASYNVNTVTAPTGPPLGELRIHRGGSAYDPPIFTRSACRLASVPERSNKKVGFRVARTVPK